MKIVASFRTLFFTNILTAGVTVLLMIQIKQKEVTRRDQIIMTALASDVAVYKLIEAGQLDSAKEHIFTTVELISSARNQFSLFGYEAWHDIDDYLRREGLISEIHLKDESE